MLAFDRLPSDIISSFILPLLSVGDLLSLGRTNHTLLDLTSDNLVWKNSCAKDFAFPQPKLPSTGVISWRKIYRKMANPIKLGWGSSDNGRLGFPDGIGSGPVNPDRAPFPIELPRIPEGKIVELVGGSWSMNALDAQGRIHVMGALDGSTTPQDEDAHDFLDGSVQIDTFHRLSLPVEIASLSFGLDFAMALDAESKIWVFVTWGAPARIIDPGLSTYGIAPVAVQVSAGHPFCAALTYSGDVHVWWPDGIRVRLMSALSESDGYTRTRFRDVKTVDYGVQGTIKEIPCLPVDLHIPSQELPQIPPLPTLRCVVEPKMLCDKNNSRDDGLVRLVKIAAMQGAIIGLTNQGHVLIMRELWSPFHVRSGRQWEYLPKFSDALEIAGSWPSTIAKPESIRITDIVAGLNDFAAFSNNSFSGQVVLLGTRSARPSSPPKILHGLQKRNIVSVSHGDYHSVALTGDGKLLTWGENKQGSLGLGIKSSHEDYAIEEPREVVFPTGRQTFCVQATASGWHTGALVIDLDNEDSMTAS